MVGTASRNVGADTRRYKRTRNRLPPIRTIMTRSQMKGSGHSSSFFQELPSEVFHMILDKLSVLEISLFSMVSKEITSYVVDYINTLSWRNTMIPKSLNHFNCHEKTSTFQHYRHLGLLFKRCTLLLPTKERLKFTFNNFVQVPCFMMEPCLTPDCIDFSSLGVFLQTLIAGWDELECHRVFIFLCDLTNVLHRMGSVISGKPGVRWCQEMELRNFCRQVLLDPWPNQSEVQFWLTNLLKSWPMVSQAKVLFILYGPLLPEGTIGWQVLVEKGVPHSVLWDLAKAILLLFVKQDTKGWSTDSTLAILEELIVIPQPWHVENVARLLVLCGDNLCYTVLASKALNGRVPEIPKLIVFIILVCEKDGYHMSWAVKLVQEICKVFKTAPERFCFIQHLESMFSEVTKEFFESSVAGNHHEDWEPFQTLCILLSSSARFHTEFFYTLLK